MCYWQVSEDYPEGRWVSSYSQIDQFEQCQRRWFYSKIERIEEEGRSKHLVYGSAVHEALENIVLSYKNGTPMTLKEAQAEMDRAIREYDVPFDSPEERMEWQFEAARFVDRLYTEGTDVFRLIREAKEVLGVEHQFDYLHGDVHILGFIDLVLRLNDDSIVIIDYKSGGSLFKKDRLENGLQFPIYAMVAEQEWGQLPTHGVYIHTRLQKMQKVPITKEKIEDAKLRIDEAFRKMKQQLNTAKPTNLCYWCPYSKHKMDICPFSSSFVPKGARR